MKPQISTNREQSDRLLKCGVPCESADLARYEDDSVSIMEWDWSSGSYGGTFPAWSLSALLSLLPKEIYDENDDMFYWRLSQCFPLTDEYAVEYVSAWFEGKELIRKRDNSPIEACVQLIEWLTANNYQLNNIE